ncbi:hypothetical protein IQ235_03910 [Oscillatoriales cyanobacterium LEGE 11467]|uniref:Uncharacterized protein n=1 Tax=Zarconia navalis LEGE 11467 TaxID=1828826 RepID=A0A928Z633_9CYAN|nr:hypothetical protein [Zarconia navalis]MBE9039937.1 hypothetical protein [Zarconia navalis LEGE 11467]
METLRSLIIGLPIVLFCFMAVDFVVGLVFHFRNGIPKVAVAAPFSTITKPANVEVTSETPLSDPSPISSESAQNESEMPDVLLDVIKGLTKRELRKILSPLGVRQKHNGVEITTELAVAKVTRIYKEDSAKVTAVIRDKLPDKLPVELSMPEETIATATVA